MLSEKQLEDIICKYPELLEQGLTLKGRQIHVYGKIMDILFEDKFGQDLVVELKKGTVSRQDVGQVMDYVGRILHEKKLTTRAMLVGSRVPPSFQKSMDYFGIEWKEIGLLQLQVFLTTKQDEELLTLFDGLEPTSISQVFLEETEHTKMDSGHLTKREPGWRSKEKRKISPASRGSKVLLEHLMNEGKPLGMNEIAHYMHSKGFSSRTFYNWADGLVADGLVNEVKKEGKQAYVIKAEG